MYQGVVGLSELLCNEAASLSSMRADVNRLQKELDCMYCFLNSNKVYSKKHNYKILFMFKQKHKFNIQNKI